MRACFGVLNVQRSNSWCEEPRISRPQRVRLTVKDSEQGVAVLAVKWSYSHTGVLATPSRIMRLFPAERGGTTVSFVIREVTREVSFVMVHRSFSQPHQCTRSHKTHIVTYITRGSAKNNAVTFPVRMAISVDARYLPLSSWCTGVLEDMLLPRKEESTCTGIMCSRIKKGVIAD